MLIRIVIVMIAWACIILWAQRFLIYPKRTTTSGYDPPRPESIQSLWLDTPEGPVESWLLMGQGVTNHRPGAAVIFAHGNGELIDDWPILMMAYHQAGITSLLVEYRGYGRSSGHPSQQVITQDFVHFYDQLAARGDVDPKRIVFHGRSLGGGVVCALAQKRPPAAIILQSTFISVTRLARRMLVPSFLILDPYDNLTVVEQLSCPTLIIHGQHDKIIPIHHGRQLHKAASNSHLLIYDCGHNDCPPDWDAYWIDVKRFLSTNKIISKL